MDKKKIKDNLDGIGDLLTIPEEMPDIYDEICGEIYKMLDEIKKELDK